MNKNFCFMAFAKGVDTSNIESTNNFKKYVGVAPVKILAINPTLAESEKLLGYALKEEPTYKTTEIVDGKSVNKYRVDIYLATVPEKCNGIKQRGRVSFFLSNKARYNTNGDKIQVMDKYGRTAWVTTEEFKSKTIPTYSNGPANIDKDYRELYTGEENLTAFIRAYLALPSTTIFNKNTNTYTQREDLTPCEGTLTVEEFKKIISGDIKVLRDVFAVMPNNTVKVLFGLKDDTYITVFPEKFLAGNSVSIKPFEKPVNTYMERQSSVRYEVCELKELTLTPTDLSTTPGIAMPTNFTEPTPVDINRDELPF